MILIINNNEIILNKEKKIKIFNLNWNFKKQKVFFTLYIRLNGIKRDIYFNIDKNASIIKIKYNNIKSLDVIRHSSAHLMAHAIKNLYPKVLFSVGPVIKNGFYYDFFLKEKISNNDLKKIENEMKKIVNSNFDIIKEKPNIIKLLSVFKNNKYKINIIKNLQPTKEISVYKQGDFIDLCYGPHIKNTKFLRHFKLIRISGAYWKNDSNNEMLYRIYGTAWDNENNLLNYLYNIKRLQTIDHRIIGKKQGLFHLSRNSPGVIFWNNNGWKIFNSIKKYISFNLEIYGYKEINTPSLLNEDIFKKSGHIDKFLSNMFIYKDNFNTNVLKPMSCPCHIEIFNNFNKKSYKNLPLRFSEFGLCYRNEISGSLYGLMRLKGFTQDDGHILCSIDKLYFEIIKFIQLLKKIYYRFNFKIFKIILAKRPNNISDNIKLWEKAEEILEKSLKIFKMNYSVTTDGAFYGPKLEFLLKDNCDRIWQCGTVQLDFFTCLRLNAKYDSSMGKLKYPVLIHRAILGSIERFLGILLENNHGYIPFYFSETQIIIIYINNKYLNYAKNVYNILKYKYKSKLYVSNDRLDTKIKICIEKKIPYILILGEKEFSKNMITVRSYKSEKFLMLKIKDFILELNKNNI
jgi:threonyl-tRNA synthetase